MGTFQLARVALEQRIDGELQPVSDNAYPRPRIRDPVSDSPLIPVPYVFPRGPANPPNRTWTPSVRTPANKRIL